MPSIPKESFPPKCWFCRKIAKGAKTVVKNAKEAKQVVKITRLHYLKYAIFYLLGIEFLSVFINGKSIAYAPLWYPLLTNFAFSLLLINYLSFEGLKVTICQRKKAAINTLIVYYVFGALCLIFQSNFYNYISFVKYILLGTCFFILLLSIFKNQK
jgi:hypothetical protein